MTTPMTPRDHEGPPAPPPGDAGRGSSDYLWDRSGPVDPAVERLENVLAGSRLRQTDGPSAEPEPFRYGVRGLGGAGAFRASRIIPLAAILALMVSLGAWYMLRERTNSDGWHVLAVDGTPLADGRTLAPGRVLQVGAWLETDSASSAKVKVAGIGSVEVSANSRLRIQTTQESKHLIELDYGRIQAVISARPRVFFVQTRAALATDMGCRYDLEMPKSGPGLLTVTLGWVELEGNAPVSGEPAWRARVPRGASCVIDDRLGPGTPFRVGATQLQNLLSAYDTRGWGTVTGAELDQLLAMCGARDAMTVWHLLCRVSGAMRAAVYARLGVLVTIPGDIDADEVMNLDPVAMDRLWSCVAWD